MNLSKTTSAALTAFLSLLMVPSFSAGLPAPSPTPPPSANANASDDADNSPQADSVKSTAAAPALAGDSNVGAVNEGGGSANTNGMNNGTMPNSSGSGSNAALATDYLGIPFGGTGKPTSGEVEQQNGEQH